MRDFINYSSIVIKDGKRFLCDEHFQSRRCAQVEALEADLQAVRDFLTNGGFPSNEDTIMAVANNGAIGLQDALEAEATAQVKKSKMSDFVKASLVRFALSSLTEEVREQADHLSDRFHRDGDGLPVRSEDYFLKDGRILNGEAIKARVAEACRREVTEDDIEMAETILTLANEIRELELRGINARELVGKYVTTAEAPAPLEIYRDIVTRRHRPGFVLPPVPVAEIVKKMNEQSNGGEL